MVLVLALTAWNNLVVHRLPGSPGSHLPVHVAATVVLLAGARLLGFSRLELGLARSRLTAGLRWGGACAAVVGTGYALVLAVPGLRSRLDGGADAEAGAAEVAFEVLVRIPLGTVLWEEVAFRAVLLAVLLRALRPLPAAAVSAAAFGAWHVRTALDGLPVDGVAEGRGLAVLLTCLGTAAAGAVLAWLRLRSGSLVAPALLHLSTNALGTLAAVVAHRAG